MPETNFQIFNRLPPELAEWVHRQCHRQGFRMKGQRWNGRGYSINMLVRRERAIARIEERGG